MEENHLAGVSGIPGSDQLSQCHRHFLSRCEAILSIEDHDVAAIQHENCGRGTLIFALVDVQIAVREVEGKVKTLSTQGTHKGSVNVNIESVSELIGTALSIGFNPGREFSRRMITEAGLAQR